MTVEEIKEHNIENVLREAARLFAQTGPERTSMEAIAMAAHVTRRSVLNYFPSKNALIHEVHNREMREMGDAVAEHLHSAEFLRLNGLEQLLDMLRFFFAVLKTQHKYANSMTEMAMILRRDPDTSLMLDYTHIISNVTDKLQPIYRLGLADGSIRPGAPLREDMLDTLSLTLRGLFRQMAFLLQNASPSELSFADKVSADYIAMIRALLENPAAPAGRAAE